jgi:hypothetical protein
MSHKPGPNELGKKTSKIIKKSKETAAMVYLRNLEGGKVEIPTQEEIINIQEVKMAKARNAVDNNASNVIVARQTNLVKARAKVRPGSLKINMAKARDAINHQDPELIATRQANAANARNAIDNNAPNVIVARQANLVKARLKNPSHIKHNQEYNELFNECIQIPETPRDEDEDE